MNKASIGLKFIRCMSFVSVVGLLLHIIGMVENIVRKNWFSLFGGIGGIILYGYMLLLHRIMYVGVISEMEDEGSVK